MQPAPPVQQVQQQPVQPMQPAPVQQQNIQAQMPMQGSNSSFDKAMQLVLRNEGGYTTFSKKLGGETNFGIIEDTFNSAKKRGYISSPSVRGLTKDDAIKIYRTDFWRQSKADQMPDALASVYFDTYIQRPTAGGEVLQRAINRFAGRNIVNVDTRVGSQTMNAVKSLIRNNDDLRRFVNVFCDERAARIMRVNATKKNEKHLVKGYLARNERCRKWALGQIPGGNSPVQYQQSQAPVQAQPQQQVQQAQAPQITPEYPVDFSQDYGQNYPHRIKYGIYPNYHDYLISPEYSQGRNPMWGGLIY